jgi:hypothetical protein
MQPATQAIPLFRCAFSLLHCDAGHLRHDSTQEAAESGAGFRRPMRLIAAAGFAAAGR